jgi:hypothetical protein
MKPTDKPKKAPTPPPARPKPKAGEKVPGTAAVRFSAIIFNVIGAVASMLFLSSFFQHHEPDPVNPTDTHINSGYDWMLNTMLKGNLEMIEKNPDKNLQQKYELKWGPGEIICVNEIKAKVPDTAIVLLPPAQLFKELGYVMTQTGPVIQRLDQPNCKNFSMSDLPWITYFLYPRRFIYADSVHSQLYAQASYIVSIGGWGLDKVKYTVDKPEPFMVLPITKQP